jgi:putative ABC transport system permease protein
MLIQDIRYAVRTLLNNRGFTTVAIVCLALGIGVNVAIFSLVDGVLLKPFPFADGERIIALNSTNKRLGVGLAGISYLDLRDWREQTTTLSDIAGFQRRSLTISDNRMDPERYQGAAVTWSLFHLLGIPPAGGRDFGPDDDRVGAEPVIIIGDDVWKQRYDSSPDIIGRAVSVNGRSHTIIGVMPPKFAFPQIERLWVPLAPSMESSKRDARSLGVFARMKPGVSQGQVQADLDAVTGRLAAAYPAENADWRARIRQLKEVMLPSDVNVILMAMMGAATLVLLIACANVANLLLARASVRQREISIRAALGAGRPRIIRQLLTEAVLIGLVSVPLGIAVAWIGLHLLQGAIPQDGVPYYVRWSLDARSLAYAVAVSMLTGIVFGLAPAVQVARTNLHESLKEGGRGAAGSSRTRLRSTFVVTEVALSLVLLVGASLFVRSFLNLQGSAVGFETKPLLTMRFFLPGVQYEDAEAKARRAEDVVRRVESLPGVQNAFASNLVPLGGGGGAGRALVDGKAFEPGKEPFIGFVATSPHMLRTMNLTLVRGRDFTDAEGWTRTPVAVINQAMAKRIWGDDDPVGRRFRLGGDRIPDWFTVIGVVTDFRHFAGDGGNQPPPPSAYVPYRFEPAISAGLVIRVAGDPGSVTAAVRDQIRQADSSLPVFQIRSMEELHRLSYWQDRLFGWIFSIFGAIALVLATIGVYGVLSYSVSQRTQEIGVRVALGAGRRVILRLVIGQGLRLAAVGIIVGLGAAFLVTRFIRTLLYNVTATDPLSFTSVSLFLVIMAFVASYVPARRALAVDPIVALRNE